MPRSKNDVLHDFFRLKIEAAIKEHAANCVLNDPARSQLIMRDLKPLAYGISYDLARNPYTRKELEDILAWKLKHPLW